ncbi:hypothetical protein OF117_21725 [Geodermatophilus sp. YIM 151500]|uniref:hypothetical protein n=1 Tax=Geodermatophilus sp. YIM 151500 TaxID=2984531 RepID=UPI0021E4D1D3|nr:hypothetical protein [Geodermatophilus sp. YIM 151500]MCV2491971.1 hypothetical protein [Geodermatophilus sp. YIM 151500]
MTIKLRDTLGTAAAAVLLCACGAAEPSSEAGGASPPASDEEPAATTAPVVPPPGDDLAARFSPDLFGPDSATITNEWLPFTPGTRFTWEGRALEEGEEIERQVIFTVTDLTKEVAGVRTLVGWDRDYNDGFMSESELIFLAQDEEGNVWHLGQYRETYEDEFVGGRVWVVGDPEGAQAGVMMKADPQAGDADYSQGYAPMPWSWDDRARVRDAGVRICVETGCYDDTIVVEEFEPSVPDALQLKYYARGVGNVMIGWEGPNEAEQEEMELVEVVQLTPEQLADARAAALDLEHRGLAYSRIGPLQPLDGAATSIG